MLQHVGALFSPLFFQIDTWYHRAHCLFYVSICTTSRLMGTQPETQRQSWNILSAGAPRLINGTLDSMINTCASSYYKKIGGNLRWPGIDFFSPLSPRTSSPSFPFPVPTPMTTAATLKLGLISRLINIISGLPLLFISQPVSLKRTCTHFLRM